MSFIFDSVERMKGDVSFSELTKRADADKFTLSI
mgnify:CR=1 FL=1